MSDERPRGVLLRKLALAPIEAEVRELDELTPEHRVSFGHDPWAMREHEGRMYVVCHEGVGWEVTEDRPLRLPVYVSQPGYMSIFPRHEVLLNPGDVHQHLSVEEIDLADLVRTFGGRLESNFWQWHGRFTGVFA